MYKAVWENLNLQLRSALPFGLNLFILGVVDSLVIKVKARYRMIFVLISVLKWEPLGINPLYPGAQAIGSANFFC